MMPHIDGYHIFVIVGFWGLCFLLKHFKPKSIMEHDGSVERIVWNMSVQCIHTLPVVYKLYT